MSKSRPRSLNDLDVEELVLEPLNARTMDNLDASQVTKQNKLKRIFDRYDSDNDGKLTMEELKQLINERSSDMSKNLVSKLMKICDKNKDGCLCYKEYIEMDLRYPQLLMIYYEKYCNIMVPTKHIKDKGYNFWVPGFTMILFSILQIIIFLIDWYLTETHDPIDGPIARSFLYSNFQRVQIWRFVSYMFTHVNFEHLFINVIIQISIGITLEKVHGCVRIAIVYLSGVIVGSLACSVLTPEVFLVGASAGVCALLSSHFASIIMNWNDMENPTIPSIMLITFTGWDFSISFVNYMIAPIENEIADVAHLFGIIAGLLVGIIVLRNVEEKKWETNFWWICVVIYMIIILMFIRMHIFATEYFDEFTKTNYVGYSENTTTSMGGDTTYTSIIPS